jgi:hypothetical protein
VNTLRVIEGRFVAIRRKRELLAQPPYCVISQSVNKAIVIKSSSSSSLLQDYFLGCGLFSASAGPVFPRELISLLRSGSDTAASGLSLGGNHLGTGDSSPALRSTRLWHLPCTYPLVPILTRAVELRRKCTCHPLSPANIQVNEFMLESAPSGMTRIPLVIFRSRTLVAHSRHSLVTGVQKSRSGLPPHTPRVCVCPARDLSTFQERELTLLTL